MRVHLNSLLIYREHVAHRIPDDARILEIGADGDPSTYCRESGTPAGWETADLATDTGQWNLDRSTAKILMPNEYEIPVPDDTYDVVLSGQVAEHVRELWTWMTELARVVKPGGQVITISPCSWEYHEAPVDCWRIYPAGMEALSRFAGLTVTHCWWGTLETPQTRNSYPGNGYDGHNARTAGVKGKVRKALGWPTAVAYDMVTIATK